MSDRQTYLQPDGVSCVPTAGAYLIHKQLHRDYEEVFVRLLEASRAKYDELKDGMSFQQLAEVATQLGYQSTVVTEPPADGSGYLAAVMRLPKADIYTDALQAALDHGSAVIDGDEFYYPHGHAIAVFPSGKTATILDPLLGVEQQYPVATILQNQEEPIIYFTVV